MTIDEAISDFEKMMKHQEDTAAYNIRHGGTEYAKMAKANKKKAFEYRQLAEWLKELKDYRERIPSYEAGYNDAKREIALNGEYERAYERGKADAQTAPQWIPVSERLPEKPDMYIVTDSKGDVVRFVFNDTESSRKYWLRCAKAWMPLPERYKASPAGEEVEE